MDRKQKRRQFIDRILKKAEDGDPDVSWQCWQQQPYTAVRVELDVAGSCTFKVGLGFAKVSWPDRWDVEEGQQIALQKAIAAIWRQVMNAPLYETMS